MDDDLKPRVRADLKPCELVSFLRAIVVMIKSMERCSDNGDCEVMM